MCLPDIHHTNNELFPTNCRLEKQRNDLCWAVCWASNTLVRSLYAMPCLDST